MTYPVTAAFTNNPEAANYEFADGTVTEVTVTIEKVDIADAEIELEQDEYVYDGTERKPAVVSVTLPESPTATVFHCICASAMWQNASKQNSDKSRKKRCIRRQHHCK